MIGRTRTGKAAALLLLSVASLAWGSPPADGAPHKDGPLLAENPHAPRWYQRRAAYTDWPAEIRDADLVEVPHVEYSLEALMVEVIRPEVLPEDWQRRVLRRKGWIAESAFGSDLDAYLYRQSWNGGTLHVCDTRPSLVIAFAPDGDIDYLRRPGESLQAVAGSLLTVELPAELSFRRDEATGMFLGREYYRCKPGVSGGGPGDESQQESVYCLAMTVARNVVIFEFQKRRVAGCVLDWRYPLFRRASAEPPPAQRVLEQLDGIGSPRPADIPALVKLLAQLPTVTAQDAQRDPYEAGFLGRARQAVTNALTQSLQGISSTSDAGIELARAAVKAARDRQDLPRGHRLTLTEAACDALRRIGTKAARQAHLEIVEGEEDRQIRAHLIKDIGECTDDEWVARRLRALAQQPDEDPTTLQGLLRHARMSHVDGDAVKAVATILRRSEDARVRRTCAEWIRHTSQAVGSLRQSVKVQLTEALDSKDRHLRLRALSGLARCGDGETCPTLLPLLSADDELLQVAAARCLSSIAGWPVPLRTLRRREGARDTWVANVAERGRMLAEALRWDKDERPQGRPCGIESLARSPKQTPASSVVIATDRFQAITERPDKHPAVTIALVRGVDALAGEDILPLVGQVLSTSENPRTKVAAAMALKHCADAVACFRDAAASGLTGPLQDAPRLSRRSPGEEPSEGETADGLVQRALIAALSHSGDLSAARDLYPLLDSEDAELRSQAARGLACLFSWPGPARDASRSEVGEWERVVKERAEKILEALAG